MVVADSPFFTVIARSFSDGLSSLADDSGSRGTGRTVRRSPKTATAQTLPGPSSKPSATKMGTSAAHRRDQKLLTNSRGKYENYPSRIALPLRDRCNDPIDVEGRMGSNNSTETDTDPATRSGRSGTNCAGD